MSAATEISKLCREARRLGIRVDKLARHWRWTMPDGESVTISTTPGSGTTESALRRLLRRHREAA